MIQNELERGFIKHHEFGEFSAYLSDIVMKTFPYEDQFNQIFAEIMMIILPIALVFSMFATVSSTTKVI